MVRTMPAVLLMMLFAAIGTRHASAQCMNTVSPSCGVYSTCFAKYCPCKGDANEYFISFGKRYCERFLGIQNFSSQGRKWRDSTLVCLQETIVPHLDISENPMCNCGAMRKIAIDSHVTCYTKSGASICDLPAGDINEIRRVIDVSDLFSSEGWKQMWEVSKICKSKAPDDGRRAAWSVIESILALR